MNINPDFSDAPDLDAETAMQACMDGIAELLLEPAMAKDELSTEDQTLLGIIGMTMKTIAQKATAYENLGNISDQNEHFRN